MLSRVAVHRGTQIVVKFFAHIAIQGVFVGCSPSSQAHAARLCSFNTQQQSLPFSPKPLNWLQKRKAYTWEERVRTFDPRIQIPNYDWCTRTWARPALGPSRTTLRMWVLPPSRSAPVKFQFKSPCAVTKMLCRILTFLQELAHEGSLSTLRSLRVPVERGRCNTGKGCMERPAVASFYYHMSDMG